MKAITYPSKNADQSPVPVLLLRHSQWRPFFCFGLLVWLATFVAFTFIATRHWPLVNDGALQHYISFLMDHGFAPYRQIQDMNLPGSLLLDWTVVHTFGPGPVSWRAFDTFLLGSATVALLVITGAKWQRFETWFPGLISAALFTLFHARDGMGQTGQRDLSEAVLLLGAAAFAFVAVRRRHYAFMSGFGLCASAALTIKPDCILFTAILFLLTIRELHRYLDIQPLPFLVTAFASLMPPLVLVGVFLHRNHAVRAFWFSVTEITPYYASLGRLSFSALLRDCLSAPMRFLALSAVSSALVAHSSTEADLSPTGFSLGSSLRWERFALAMGTLWGIASFFLQGKGYPYQRYPALAFLLPFFAIECTLAFRSRRLLAISVGLAGLLYGGLVVAPECFRRALNAKWDQSHIEQLDRDLVSLGATSPGNTVQCIDSVSGCNTALLRLGISESTGMLSDFLLFGPDSQPAVRHTRNAFLPAMEHQPPRLFVVTSWLHPSGVPDYRKLALWPAFSSFLSARYTLIVQRDFRPGPTGPLGYRIYQLR